MDLIKKSLRCLVPGMLLLLFTFGLNLAAPKQAEAGEFELGTGFGWLGNVSNGSEWHGFHFVISPGYRFRDWGGVYIDQGLGGLFYKPPYMKRISEFAGQTVFNVKLFFPINSAELWGRVGIGAFYIAYDWGSSGWGQPSGHDSAGAFAFKLGVGVTFPLTSRIGVGANFDYLLAAFDAGNAHMLDFLLHLRFKF